MSNEETRRQFVRRNHESISRTILALNTMEQSFRDDEARVTKGQISENLLGVRETRRQCEASVVTLVMLLKYAGLTDAEMLVMADQIDDEWASFSRTGTHVTTGAPPIDS